MNPTEDHQRPRIGISTCLLGEAVRYDGGHKWDAGAHALSGAVDWVPVCPEVELGMSVPREPVDLVLVDDVTRMIAPGSKTDHTEAMGAFAAARVKALLAQGLHGYVLKSKSPSCGLDRVKRYRPSAEAPIRDGIGLFAQALLQKAPDLPVVAETELVSEKKRQAFLQRVRAYHTAAGAGA